MRGINSLPVLFILLILSSLPQPIHAQVDCSVYSCYDENLPVLVGDIFNWHYTRDMKNNFDAFAWDFGLWRDFPIKPGEIANITIGIIKDIRGIPQPDTLQRGSEYKYYKYYNKSIQIEGISVDPDKYVNLALSDFIHPTIRHEDSKVVNAIEYFADIRLEEYTYESGGKYIFRTNQYEFRDGIYYHLENMTFSDSDTFTNLLSFNYRATQIDISTGFLIIRTHFAQDYINNATYESEFSFQNNSDIQESQTITVLSELTATLSLDLAPLVTLTLIGLVTVVKKKE